MNAPSVSHQSSRRDFLKTSAAAVAGATVAGLDIARTAHAAGGDIIKVGLIGSGDRGAVAALDAMKADPGVRIVAMADLFKDRVNTKRELLKKQRPDQMLVDDDHCFVGFDAYKQVIESADVVLIACASKFHPKYLKAAIDAGKHVFLEKPAAIDPPGIRTIIAAADEAKKKNLCLVSGLVYRYNPGIRETIKRIHDGAIGDIVAIESNFLRAPYRLIERKPELTETEYQFSNWYHFSWLSGDDVIQSLVHNLDKASLALHEATPLKAHGLAGRSASFGDIYGDVFDHHSVVYYYPNNLKLYAFCRTQVGCHGETSDILMGTKGRCDLMKFRIEGENKWHFEGNVGNPYEIEHQELFAAIRSGKPLNNGDYMAHSTMVSILGQMACYTGQMVEWDQALNANFTFGPPDGDFSTPPPVKPGPDGNYPLAVPGKTKLV